MIRYMPVVLRLSILAASIALALAACSGERELVPNIPEEESIQTSMLSMMADREVTSVTPSTRSTNSFIDNPTGTSTSPLYPTYMRDANTTCYYCWDSTGTITRQDDSSAPCRAASSGATPGARCLVPETDVARDPNFGRYAFPAAEIGLIAVAALVLLVTLRWLRRKRSD